MTASELHALYAPLWEAVPEARPHALDYQVATEPDELDFWSMEMNVEVPPEEWDTGDDWKKNDDDDDRGCVALLPSHAAAALCRVAVEDWLVAKVGSLTIGRTMDDTSPARFVRIDRVDGKHLYTDADDGAHAALVAAALAVAESLKPKGGAGR